MSSTNIFGICCGAIFGLFMVLLFNEKARGALTQRSPWLAEHPRGYVLLLAITAMAILGVGYLLAIRFA